MRLLADECCEASMVAALRADGHDIVFVIENLRGSTDDQVLNLAYSESRILITEDKDFGELVSRLRRPTHGIILLRFDDKHRAEKISRLREVLKNRSNKLKGVLTVVDENKIRVRPLSK
jgi:predicted nuclease of predicted toxin-antitoxin system